MLIALALVMLGAEPVKVATPGLRTLPADPSTGSIYTEHLANQLSAHGLQMITERDVQTLLGMERQRQLLGCAEAAAECFAELGSALGAEAVLVGDVVKSGSGFQINLKVIRSTNGQSLATFSKKVGADDVLDVLTEAAEPMALSVRKALRPNEVVAARSRGSPLKWVALGVAVVGVGVGVGGLALAGGDGARLKRGAPALMPGEEVAIVAAGQRAETIGWVGIGAGVAAATAGAFLFFWAPGDSSSATVIVVPSEQGATVGFSGRF